MKRFLLLPVLALAVPMLRAAEGSPLPVPEPGNPLMSQRADPQIILHSDGYYYATATVPEYNRIEVRRAKTLGGLRLAEPKIIWRM